MKTTLFLALALDILLYSLFVYAVDIGNFEEYDCDWNEILRQGAKVNKIAQVLMVDTKFGAIDATFNGRSLVGLVGARGLDQKNGQKARCIAKRYVEVMVFKKEKNATRAWHLPGSLENHKRYTDAVENNLGKSNAEILALASGIYHANYEQALVARESLMDDSFPWIKADEDKKRDIIPDSFPWIAAGEDEASEDQKRDIIPDSFPWIEAGEDEASEDQKRDIIPDSFPWIEAGEDEASEDHKRDIIPDSFPWIKAGEDEASENEKRDINPADTPVSGRDALTKDEEQDGTIKEVEEESFPWIS
ncbi:hypothetical protein IFR05_014509 [Cadophora sp. M221]|nr:hypothetical protein IFR05_014509 [Cadophora sp. M221]